MSQADLEAEMQQLGVDRTKKRQARATERGLESTTAGGARFLRDMPKVVVDAIEEWKKQAHSRPGIRHKALGKLESRDVRTIAALTLRVVLDSLSHARGYTRTAMQIATRLEDEERYAAFKKQSSVDFRYAIQRSEDFSSYGEKRRHILTAMTLFGFERPKWDEAMKAAVGVTLLELVIEHTGLLQSHTIRHSSKRTELRIQATPEALEWMSVANEQQAEMSPLYLPFIAEPLDWIDPMSGGFHSTNVFASTIVKTSDPNYIAALQQAEMQGVYSAVNALQRTSWTVNANIFEMFSYLWEHGYEASGLPVRDDAVVPPKPANIKTDELARKAWRKAARAVHDANHRHSSDRMAISRLHWVCKRYQEEKFYFCHQLDWRGRAYPVSYYLQPQGTDIVKGLLQFGEGKPVVTPEARQWHMIHGANCWGLDKKPFAERVAWVTDNEQWLRKMAEDPLDCREWEGADKPWQFLAWCMDWVQILDDPSHCSRLAIHQDATQSGIQIYSLLLRDLEGAKATNCVPSDTPQDLYGLVAERLVAGLQREKTNGVSVAEQWLDFGLDRSACKRPVMTRVYNATKHSARSYLQEWAHDKATRTGKPLPTTEGSQSPYWYLATQLWDAMSDVIASTTMAQDWFGEIAQVFAAAKKPIRWTSPLGLPIKQFYPGFDHHCVRTLIGERYRQTSLRTPNAQVNARRMKAAFAPNVVHSLDAAAMMLTVNKAWEAGITSITCNHDSYATLAADSPALAQATRAAYVQLFSGDLLTDLRTELQAQLPPTRVLPDVPTFGALDVSVLQNSPYFFS